MLKPISYIIEAEVGQEFIAPIRSFEAADFLSEKTLIQSLKQIFKDDWPLNKKAAQLLADDIKNWFTQLQPTTKSLLQDGTITLEATIKKSIGETPAELIIHPVGYNLTKENETEALSTLLFRRDKAQNTAAMQATRKTALAQLELGYAQSINTLLSAKPDVAGRFQEARYLIDLDNKGRAGLLNAPFVNILSRPEFKSLKAALGLPIADFRGLADQKFFEEEWSTEKITDSLVLKASVFSDLDITLMTEIPRSVNDNMARLMQGVDSKECVKIAKQLPPQRLPYKTKMGPKFGEAQISDLSIFLEFEVLKILIKTARIAKKMLDFIDRESFYFYLRAFLGHSKAYDCLNLLCLGKDLNTTDLLLHISDNQTSYEVPITSILRLKPELGEAVEKFKALLETHLPEVARISRHITPKTLNP